MNQKDTHNYFLNPLKNKTEAIDERREIFIEGRKKRLVKMEDMLRLFGAPEENISFLKDHFYNENDIRII